MLESGITLIHDGRFYYRGQRCVEARGDRERWKQVAALLWAAEESERERLFEQPCALSSRQLAQLRACAREPLDAASSRPPDRRGRRSRVLRPAPGRGPTDRRAHSPAADDDRRAARCRRQPVHRALQAAWAPKRDAVGDVIRTALVLCADHELNVSAFTARCAASAGASPYDVVSAAMATLKGYKHGGAAERVLALAGRGRYAGARSGPGGESPAPWRERCRGSAIRSIRLAIRAPCCSCGSRRPAETTPRGGRFEICAERGRSCCTTLPNLDFGLAAVTRAYRLPDQAPLLLFALGRTIGWIAHAIEEYASGRLIRPRARYTGPAPQSASIAARTKSGRAVASPV